MVLTCGPSPAAQLDMVLTCFTTSTSFTIALATLFSMNLKQHPSWAIPDEEGVVPTQVSAQVVGGPLVPRWGHASCQVWLLWAAHGLQAFSCGAAQCLPSSVGVVAARPRWRPPAGTHGWDGGPDGAGMVLEPAPAGMVALMVAPWLGAARGMCVGDTAELQPALLGCPSLGCPPVCPLVLGPLTPYGPLSPRWLPTRVPQPPPPTGHPLQGPYWEFVVICCVCGGVAVSIMTGVMMYARWRRLI